MRNLADAIKVEVVAGIEGREDPGQLPSVAFECPAQDPFLRSEPVRLRLAPAAEYEQEQRSIVAKSKAAHLPAGSVVDDVDEFVARTVRGVSNAATR